MVSAGLSELHCLTDQTLQWQRRLKVRFCVNFFFSASANIRTRGVQAEKIIRPTRSNARGKGQKKGDLLRRSRARNGLQLLLAHDGRASGLTNLGSLPPSCVRPQFLAVGLFFSRGRGLFGILLGIEVLFVRVALGAGLALFVGGYTATVSTFFALCRGFLAASELLGFLFGGNPGASQQRRSAAQRNPNTVRLHNFYAFGS